MRLSIGSLLVVCTVGLISPATPGPTIKVPRRAAPLLDGRIDPGEWEGAIGLRFEGGGVLRLQHDGRYLFTAVSAPTVGFPSLCLARADTIVVLHASAALGKVGYVRSDGAWLARDSGFVYGMRNPDTTQPARRDRAEYLANHGWVASTSRMGDMRVYEIQISADLVNPDGRIAVGYFGAGAGSEGNAGSWPDSTGPAGEGCNDARLLSGRVPVQLRFNPSTWAGLVFEP